jgi:hypothetical protein
MLPAVNETPVTLALHEAGTVEPAESSPASPTEVAGRPPNYGHQYGSQIDTGQALISFQPFQSSGWSARMLQSLQSIDVAELLPGVGQPGLGTELLAGRPDHDVAGG